MRSPLVLLFALFAATFAAPTWTLQTTGATNVTLRGVSVVSDTVAWASGSRSTVLRTTDGGANWQKIAVTVDAVDFRDIDAIDAKTCYVLSIGNGATSRIYKTTDAGATWTLQFKNEDPAVFLDAMSFWDDAHGLAFSDSNNGQFVILTTSDAGKTWTRVPASALPPALPNEGAFAASGTNIAVLGTSDAWIGTGAAATSRVLRTHDRGKTWQVSDTPLAAAGAAGIFSVAFRDAKHGIVVGGDYSKETEAVDNIALTSDGGVTWTLVKDNALTGFRSVVAYVPHAKTPTLIAVGPRGSDVSADDGRTWTVLEGPGFHTFSFSPTGAIGFGAGGTGRVARLNWAGNR